MITITLELNRDCNMSCGYCYIGEKCTTAYMSMEIAISSINFAYKKLILDNHANKEICIDFLGGEPMLSIEMIMQIVEYTKKIKLRHGVEFKYTITTNGTIMSDTIVSFLVDNDFDLKVSLDGKKEYNDFSRKMKNHNGSYDMVINNLKYFSDYQRDARKYIQISSVLTKHNYEAYFENVKHLIGDLGFRFIDVGLNSFDKWAVEDLEIIESQFDKVLEYYNYMKSINDYFSWSVIEEIENALISEHRLYSCGAGVISFYIKYDGSIFTCPSCFDDNYKIGGVNNGLYGDFYEYLKSIIHLKDIKNEKCSNCKLSKKCTVKGCFINSLIENNSINVPRNLSCKMFLLKYKFYKKYESLNTII